MIETLTCIEVFVVDVALFGVGNVKLSIGASVSRTLPPKLNHIFLFVLMFTDVVFYK